MLKDYASLAFTKAPAYKNINKIGFSEIRGRVHVLHPLDPPLNRTTLPIKHIQLRYVGFARHCTNSS